MQRDVREVRPIDADAETDLAVGTTPRREAVVLVDAEDREVGTAEKLFVHRHGLLHRAFSIFLFNTRDEMLLQRRADGKYHSGGLWSNACCGHPRPGEGTADAAARRLYEELGMCASLSPAAVLRYRAQVNDELTEYEVDHLFIGFAEGPADPDPREVSETRWIARADLDHEIGARPGAFSAWFPPALACVSGLSVPGSTESRRASA